MIEREGVLPKRHPCCGSTHLVLDALLDLRARHGFTADAVRRVETHVGIANARNLAYPDPRNAMEARFSMSYCVARVLVQDRLTLDDFTDDAVAPADIRRLLPLVTMTAYTAEEERASRSGRLPIASRSISRMAGASSPNVVSPRARSVIPSPMRIG